MAIIRLTADEMFEVMKTPEDKDRFANVWTHIAEIGFLFNEFTLHIRGKIIDGTKLEGFLAVKDEKIVGLITYMMEDNECEIVSLNSFEENNSFLENNEYMNEDKS